jgi:hypothetical protein
VSGERGVKGKMNVVIRSASKRRRRVAGRVGEYAYRYL